MPILTSQGLGAAKGYGFSQVLSGGGPDGTVGIFYIGYSSTTINKYTYASDTSTATGAGCALYVVNYGSGAAGNCTAAIVQVGQGSCQARTTRTKYTYATFSNSASGVAVASQTTAGGIGAGNKTIGIFALGMQTMSFTTSAVRNKYTYASDTSAVTTSSSQNSSFNAAAGNSTRAIFQLGSQTCGPSNYQSVRNKFTYACDTSTASGVATPSAATNGGNASSNSTMGIFALSGTSTCTTGSALRDKYTFATCTSAATTALISSTTTQRQGGSATGNSTRGIFQRGLGTSCFSNAIRCKYTYACATVVAAASASTCNRFAQAFSFATGVNS